MEIMQSNHEKLSGKFKAIFSTTKKKKEKKKKKNAPTKHWVFYEKNPYMKTLGFLKWINCKIFFIVSKGLYLWFL